MTDEIPSELRAELDRLRSDFEALRRAVRAPAPATKDAGSLDVMIRRGVLTQAGATAESLLKFVYRREGLGKDGRPAETMALDELLKVIHGRLPEGVRNHLRTVQVWRNTGAHDRGAAHQVSDADLLHVTDALGAVMKWFFEIYLNGMLPAVADEPPLHVAAEASEARRRALKEYRETYWWTYRNGEPTLLGRQALAAMKRKLALTDDEVAPIHATYQRDVDALQQVLREAFSDGVLEELEADAIEHTREESCISRREATELALAAFGGALDLGAGAPLWLREAASQRIATPQPGSPAADPNQAVATPSVAPPGPAGDREPARGSAVSLDESEDQLVQTLLAGWKLSWGLHLPPIPERKLAGITEYVDTQVAGKILLVFDSTFFGSATRGITVCRAGIVWRLADDSRSGVAWSAIESVGPHTGSVWSGGNGIALKLRQATGDPTTEPGEGVVVLPMAISALEAVEFAARVDAIRAMYEQAAARGDSIA